MHPLRQATLKQNIIFVKQNSDLTKIILKKTFICKPPKKKKQHLSRKWASWTNASRCFSPSAPRTKRPKSVRKRRHDSVAVWSLSQDLNPQGVSLSEIRYLSDDPGV